MVWCLLMLLMCSDWRGHCSRGDSELKLLNTKLDKMKREPVSVCVRVCLVCECVCLCVCLCV